MFDTGEPGTVPPARSGDLAATPTNELEAELTQLTAQIAVAQARQLELTAELDRRRDWGRQGCTSAAHWLTWRCGMAPGAAREHVSMARKLDELPRVKDAMAAGKLSYWQARAIARAATPETENTLVSWATQLPASSLIKTCRAFTKVRAVDQEPVDVHRRRYLNYFFDESGDFILSGRLPGDEGAVVAKGLEVADRRLWKQNEEDSQASRRDPHGPPQPKPSSVDALVALAESFLESHLKSGSTADRYQVVVHVDAAVLRGGAGACHAENAGPLSAETVQRLCCDSSLVTMLERDGKVLGSGRKTRKISTHLRRALVARDKGCVFPGCGRTLHTDGHHIRSWTADRGETELDNLTLVCRFHHRLVHEGGYRVTLDDDGSTHFFTPNGVEVRPSPDLVARGPTLEERSLARGIEIDAETIRGTWDGENLDLGSAIASLADMQARPEQYPENHRS